MKTGIPSSVATKIRAEGVFVRGSALSIKFIPGDETRYAPVVSKRQGNAVQRNRVKRVVRHLFAEHAATVPGGAYLLFIRGQCESFCRESVQRDVMTFISRANRFSAREG